MSVSAREVNVLELICMVTARMLYSDWRSEGVSYLVRSHPSKNNMYAGKRD
jgi:hypothetical protein